ncbi:MAG: hypothetical protein ACTSYI_00345 [Promethearchaeota archaeon]
MTFQAQNLIYLNEQQVGFAGFVGKGLYIPSDFGIKTRSATTECWRGYIVHFFDSKFEFQEGTVINIEESQERTI